MATGCESGGDRTVLISLHIGTEREVAATQPPMTVSRTLRGRDLHVHCGALAQLGERLICIQEVIGSIPIGSTTSHLRSKFDERVAKDGRACGVRSVIARLDRALLEEIGSVAQVVRAYA